MAAAREVDEPMVNPEDSPEATLAAPKAIRSRLGAVV
jgi:hypothetical protein